MTKKTWEEVGTESWPRRRFLGTVGAGALGVAAGVTGHTAAQAGPDAARGVQQLVLVDEGEARSVIVVEEPGVESVVDAAHELRDHIAKASGVELEIIGPGEPPRERVAIHIGEGRLAKAIALARGVELEPEEFWITSVGNKILILGHDFAWDPSGSSPSLVGRSLATQWAVDYLLDRYLGVRWLWPGELGTFVPAQATIAVPELDVIERPAMVMRQLRVHLWRRMGEPLENILTNEEFETVEREAVEWLTRHQMGTRLNIASGHSFKDWWDTYSATDPDYFAQPAPGYEQPWPRADRVKLRLGNPAVADQAVAEWQEAGAPDYWSIAPNDGVGFCTHESTLALDIPADQPVEDIWKATVNAHLTARYVTFWNSVLTKMRAINPDVRLLTYAFNRYRDAPPAGLTADGVIAGLVHDYWSPDQWEGWRDAGAELFLRPNWWYAGRDAPHLPVHSMGDYVEFARDQGQQGFDFDSLLGYWGVQSIIFYLVGRLSSRPDLTVDDVVEEYLSAFGAAAPAVQEYLDYWEAYSTQTAYPVPAGGLVSQDPDGLYETAVRDHGLVLNPVTGSHQVLRYLFTEDVLAPAHDILDTAEQLATGDADAEARVQFLRDGLVQLAQVRDVITLGEDDPDSPEYLIEAEKLRDLRKEMTVRHVVWGEDQYRAEHARGIPTYPDTWIAESPTMG